MRTEFYKSISRSGWIHSCSMVANDVTPNGVACFGYIAAYRWNGFDRRWTKITSCLFCFPYPFRSIVHNGYRTRSMTRRHISTAAIALNKHSRLLNFIGETLIFDIKCGDPAKIWIRSPFLPPDYG